jgi:1-deoxy-D-xylulose-5-phosphate synthase
LLARRTREGDGEVCILSVGKMLAAAEKAAVWDVRSCVPLDVAMLEDAARHRLVVTCEDGVRDGGIGMSIADRLHELASGATVRVLGLPTRFIPQGKPETILAQFGLNANGIAAAVRDGQSSL